MRTQMSSSGCSTDKYTESDLKLKSNTIWTEFLTVRAGENFFLLFLESRSYQNFCVPEIRFLAKLMDPVLFIDRRYSLGVISECFRDECNPTWWNLASL